MTRAKRIAVNIVGPPIVATGIIFLVGSFRSVATDPRSLVTLNALWGVVMILVYAFVIALIPSLLHAYVMEKIYRRFSPPHTWRATIGSMLSGLGAGILITAFFLLANGSFRANSAGELFSLLIFPGLGACVGFVLGVIIKSCSHDKDLSS